MDQTIADECIWRVWIELQQQQVDWITFITVVVVVVVVVERFSEMDNAPCNESHCPFHSIPFHSETAAAACVYEHTRTHDNK